MTRRAADGSTVLPNENRRTRQARRVRADRPGRHLYRVLLLGAVVVAVATGAAAPATAATTLTPALPAAVRLAAATGSTLTVTSARVANARGYRLFASTDHHSVTLAAIGKARRSGISATPRVTLGGLPYTTAPYYYRLQVINGSKVRYSDIMTGYVRPATPSTVRSAGAPSTGLSLSWGGQAAAHYVVTQATNKTLTAGVRRYTITSQAHRFTPYDLRRGTPYFFSVRAYNGGVASAATPALQAVAPARGQNVRVMTYNVLHDSAAGTKEGSEVVAPWSKRRVPAIALIRKADPDVLGLQEASDWVDEAKRPGVRIADDLAQGLGVGRYTVADTEDLPPTAHWMRTARYILYRTATYRAVTKGGHWTLAPGRFAAYQELQNKTTGARFLAVSVHLSFGAGLAADRQRQAETQKLLGFARAYQTSAHVPVIYVGDFNSHEGHEVDGPGTAMRAAGVADADEVAQTRVHREYNSANQYLRSPKPGHWDIDHVYAPAGVAVRRWEIALTLTGGRFAGTIPSDHNPIVADVVLPY